MSDGESYLEDVRLRSEDDDLGQSISQIQDTGGDGPDALIGETLAKTTYPTTAGAFYWCKILTILGAEVEGGAATFADTGRRVWAYNLGQSVPPSGTRVLIDGSSYRHTFRYP